MNLQLRNDYIDRIAMLAQDSYVVGAVFVTGDHQTECEDVRILMLPKPDCAAMSAFKKVNYLISTDISPVSVSVISRDVKCLVKRYVTEDGIAVTLTVSESGSVPQTEWWRVVYDDVNAASLLDGRSRTEQDILFEQPAAPAPIPAPEPIPEPVPEPEPVPVPAPIEEVQLIPADLPNADEQPSEPSPAEEPEQADDEVSEEDEYWDFVAHHIKITRRAISCGSYIQAGEEIGMLRRMLIELICVRSGVEENFERAIDSIDCEEKDMLVKTYPARADQGAMATALATITELFERLS